MTSDHIPRNDKIYEHQVERGCMALKSALVWKTEVRQGKGNTLDNRVLDIKKERKKMHTHTQV